jgi:hypothetical protein
MRLTIMLILFSLTLLMSNISSAAQNGLVVVDKATIYADVHMKHPIGFLTKWKQVRLGSIARNGGQVLPVIVSSNKIGYMNVHDLSFGRSSLSLKSTYNRFNHDFEFKHPKRNHFSLIQNSYLGNAAIGDSTFGAKTIGTNFYGFGFQMNKFYNSQISWYWGANYEKSTAADGVSITNLMSRFGGKYKLARWKKFSLLLSGNLGLAPYTAIETEYFLTRGFSLSNELGLEAYVALNSRFDFTAFAGYEVQKLLGVDLPAGLGDFNPLIIGLKLNLGLAIYY